MPRLKVSNCNMSTVVDRVGTFLRENNWKLNIPQYNLQPDIYPNKDPATVAWKLTLDWDYYGKSILKATPVGSDPGFACWAYAPQIDTSPYVWPGTGLPNAQFLTNLYVYCSDGNAAVPWFAVVMQYETSYRHLYIGNAEKIGAYGGGIIVSSSGGAHLQDPATQSFKDPATTNYLFGGNSTHLGDDYCGGMLITHADNPVSWRRFRGAVAATVDDVPVDSVIGGFGDGINDGLLSHAKSQFKQPILVPANLYAPSLIGGEVKFRALGRPAGIRMMNIENHIPGDVVDVGGQKWHVFPALRKDPAKEIPAGPFNWRLFDSSYFVGYAYREE